MLSHCLDFGKKGDVCFWNALLLATLGIRTSLFESEGGSSQSCRRGLSGSVFFLDGVGGKAAAKFIHSFIHPPVMGLQFLLFLAKSIRLDKREI